MNVCMNESRGVNEKLNDEKWILWGNVRCIILFIFSLFAWCWLKNAFKSSCLAPELTYPVVGTAISSITSTAWARVVIVYTHAAYTMSLLACWMCICSYAVQNLFVVNAMQMKLIVLWEYKYSLDHKYAFWVAKIGARQWLKWGHVQWCGLPRPREPCSTLPLHRLSSCFFLPPHSTKPNE